MIRKSSRIWDLFAEEYKPRKLRGANSWKTVRQYRIQINHFRRFLGREPLVSDLAEIVILRFLEWLAAEDVGKNGIVIYRSSATVNKALHAICALWRFACRQGILGKWPDIQPLANPERAPEAWFIDQVQSILVACRSGKGFLADFYDGIPRGLWWQALYVFWWSCGERTTAALSIEQDRVDLDRRSVVIAAEDRKFGRKEAQYTLGPECVEAWRRIWAPRRKLMFPWPLCWPDSFYNHHRYLLKLAGLQFDRLAGAGYRFVLGEYRHIRHEDEFVLGKIARPPHVGDREPLERVVLAGGNGRTGAPACVFQFIRPYQQIPAYVRQTSRPPARTALAQASLFPLPRRLALALRRSVQGVARHSQSCHVQFRTRLGFRRQGLSGGNRGLHCGAVRSVRRHALERSDRRRHDRLGDPQRAGRLPAVFGRRKKKWQPWADLAGTYGLGILDAAGGPGRRPDAFLGLWLNAERVEGAEPKPEDETKLKSSTKMEQATP